MHGATLIYYKDKDTLKPQGCVQISGVQHAKGEYEIILKTLHKGSEKTFTVKAASIEV